MFECPYKPEDEIFVAAFYTVGGGAPIRELAAKMCS